MVKQETLTLFPEVETVTRKMSNAQFGELMRAVLAYRFRGEIYEGEDVAVDIAFQFMASQVDRSETAKAAKAKAGKARWGRQSDGSEKKHAAEAELKRAEGEQSGAEGEQRRAEGERNAAEVEQKDPPIQSSPVQSSPVQSNPVQSCPERESTAHAHAKSAFGKFGWVKLTDQDYQTLRRELGDAELQRCIAYVDECAQATGNKNQWRDWRVVLSKCARQGWGLSGPGSRARQAVPMGATGVLGQAEMEAIQQVLKGG